MIGYTSTKPGKRYHDVLRAAGWRLLLTPKRSTLPADFHFAIDNGAYFEGFDADAFAGIIDRLGAAADFVVLPDIVAGGRASLDLSVSWISKLAGLRKLLLPIQDGMTAADVGTVLRQNVNVGLFLGGSTQFKLTQMYAWGMVAHAWKRHYHVARVNTVRRVRLCAEAGAHSFDGSGAGRFYGKVALLDPALKQPSLLTPEAQAAPAP